MQLDLSEPTATITLAFAEDQDPVVAFGDSGLHPELTLQLSADTAHELFLGKLDFFEAVGGRTYCAPGIEHQLFGRLAGRAVWRLSQPS